jgi:hypothetical protein
MRKVILFIAFIYAGHMQAACHKVFPLSAASELPPKAEANELFPYAQLPDLDISDAQRAKLDQLNATLNKALSEANYSGIMEALTAVFGFHNEVAKVAESSKSLEQFKLANQMKLIRGIELLHWGRFFRWSATAPFMSVLTPEVTRSAFIWAEHNGEKVVLQKARSPFGLVPILIFQGNEHTELAAKL